MNLLLNWLQIEANKTWKDAQALLSIEHVPDIISDPVEWATQVRRLRREPFTFDGRDYLHQLYRDDAKEIYVMKGRQTEISEMLVNKMLYNGHRYPGSIHLFISDRKSHTSKFSNLRIKEWALQASSILEKIAPSKYHTAETLPFANGSRAYFHSAWGDFEEARSVPADFVYLDELQSVNVEEINVLMETLAHSKYGFLVGVGTGTVEGSDWAKLYSSGTQYEWSIKAKAWTARNPGASIHTYNIPQTIVPWITPEMIEAKKLKYTPMRFVTEVIGGIARGIKVPLPESVVKAIFDHSISLVSPTKIDRSLGPVFAGIDWAAGGASRTVVYIAQCTDMQTPVFRLLALLKIDGITDMHKISRMVINQIKAYEPDFGVMDAGGNPTGVQDVEHEFGDLICKCSFMTRPAEPWEYDKIYENLIKVDRSFIFQKQIDMITRWTADRKTPREIIPAADESAVEWLVDDMTCLETKTIKLRSGEEHVIYLKDDSKTYDGLLAMLYKTVAYEVFKERRDNVASFGVGRLG